MGGSIFIQVAGDISIAVPLVLHIDQEAQMVAYLLFRTHLSGDNGPSGHRGKILFGFIHTIPLAVFKQYLVE
jgi:hypothetical protein